MDSIKLVAILLCATSAAALRGRATKNERKQRRIQAHSYEWAKESFPAVSKLAELIKNATCETDGDAWTKQCYFENITGCTLAKVDEDKSLCVNLLNASRDHCGFLSYSWLEKDVKFDTNLAKDYNCSGVVHNPTLIDTSPVEGVNITFKQMGAPVLMIGGTEGGPQFEVQPPTEAGKVFNDSQISVLKMDCQGCEYAIASNVLKDDPKFFHKVDQFALRAHVDKRFLATQEHLHEYNRLLQLIDEAGLKLMDARLTGCGEDKDWTKFRPPIVGLARQSHFIRESVHESCLPELMSTGYECSLNCQNFLFVRPPVVDAKNEEQKKDEQQEGNKTILEKTLEAASFTQANAGI